MKHARVSVVALVGASLLASGCGSSRQASSLPGLTAAKLVKLTAMVRSAARANDDAHPSGATIYASRRHEANIAAGAGSAFALRSSGSVEGRLSTAKFPSYGLTLRYPATWTRVDWCQAGLHVIPIALFTTTHLGSNCDPKAGEVVWPPAARLAVNGMAIALSADAIFPGAKIMWNTRIRGRLAYLAKPSYGREYDTALACPAGATREYRSALIRRPAAMNEMFAVAAVICGPDLAAGNATFRDLLASIRLSGE